ncbi:lipopolysaccharide biosynthesis protein [uncultured Thiocystis sp.]|uniref:GumC family protein n=1 Tax=uncultured Thiocystis sp. TaxID=1202134 RepID=UPI0025F57FCF|nr:lipopolysaccharide biosynthesis protein [uncultured Thiocystis sp.]
MDEQSKSRSEILEMLKRRKWYFFIPFFLLLVLSVGFTYSLPPVYRSTGKILIEQQEIPSDLVSSTITSYADNRISLVQQRVMTGSNLIQIMDKHKLFEQERREQGGDSAALELMKSAVNMELVSSKIVDSRTGRSADVTIAFTVSFDAESPQVAQSVASDLVAFYLEENQKIRQKVTQDAKLFVQQEATRLADEIGSLEEKLAAFKANSGDSLPEMMDFNQESLQKTRERLREVEQSIISLTESSILLQGELARTDPYSKQISADGERVLTASQQLAALESKYLALSSRYSAEHPDVKKLDREIRALQLDVRRSNSSGEDGRTIGSALVKDADNPIYIQIRTRLTANEAELDSRKKSRTELIEQIAMYERRIAASPSIEREYLAITRDYESALARYRDVKIKLSEAKLAEAVETESKGERFTLIDAPVVSSEPFKPNRPSMIFLGMVLAFGAGIGNMTLREALDKGIYGSRRLEGLTGAAPLAVIPFIETVADRERYRRKRNQLIVGLVGTAIIVMLIIHTFLFSLW